MYKPNFKDSRVQDRIRQALGFVQGTMSTTQSRAWSTRYIDKYLGCQSNNLSKWLRERLLIETDSTYSFGTDRSKCKEYQANARWIEYLKQQLAKPATTEQLITEWAAEDFKTELETKAFEYRDRSNRLWHPLQNVRKQHRRTLFANSGFNWEYDICAAAPTIIHQSTRNLGYKKPLPTLEAYLKDRKAYRQLIADETEISESDAKTILTALFSGATLGNIPESQLYQLLDGDLARIQFLQQNEFIRKLKADIKRCWDQLKKAGLVIPRMDINIETGEIKKYVRSREKWTFYFQEERRVLNVVRDVLDQAGIRYFLEHDGWSTDLPIDELHLLTEIKNRTGYDLALDVKGLN